MLHEMNQWTRRSAIVVGLSCALLLPLPRGAGAEEPTDNAGPFVVAMKFVACPQGRSKEGYEHLPCTTPLSLDPAQEVQPGQDQFLPLANGEAAGIRITTLETSMEIDANGDGKIDAKAKGKDSCIPLKLKSRAGVGYDYLVRITRVETSSSDIDWVFQRSCLMEGTFDKTRIRLIDDNSNGVYGEIGQDAIAIGNAADHAAPLGRLVNVNNKIYAIDVEPTGATIRLTPYAGAVGRLDVTKGYQATGKLVWAVFRCGDSWFDCAARAGGTEITVPVGTYQFEIGRVYNRPQGARIRAGRMKSLEVRKDELTALAWGGPVKLCFDYQFEGRILKVPSTWAQMVCSAGGSVGVSARVGADSVEAEGRGGEVYWRFEPEDLTPKVHIRNQATKKVVHRGNMSLTADRRVYHPGWWMWRDEYSEQVKNETGPFEVSMEEDQFTKLWPEFLKGDWK